MHFVQQIFTNLLGLWVIERKIIDHQYSQNFDITGSGNFTKSNTQCFALEYTETLACYNHEANLLMKSSQHYHYQYHEELNSISKSFSDGSNFYYINFASNNYATGEFICNKDHYKAEYHFMNDDAFAINYTITGPSKNAQIFNQYQKMP